jgi:DNA polymerase III subunit epsilon
VERRPARTPALTFAAIDFETADYQRDSACAVGVVRVMQGTIVSRTRYLIRPPRKEFVFTHIHGITWTDVARKPEFGELWPRLRAEFDGMPFLAAHNASFDRSVLEACCARAGIRPPRQEFRCSMAVARSVWAVYPTKLEDVCRRLDLTLRHHDPLSDAEACAAIVITSAMCAGCPKARGCYPARANCR